MSSTTGASWATKLQQRKAERLPARIDPLDRCGAHSQKDAENHGKSGTSVDQANESIEQSAVDIDLAVAVRGGNMAKVRQLLIAGVDVNQRDDFGETPLFDAVSNGSLELTVALILARADPTVRAKSGTTAVDFVEDPSIRAIVLAASSCEAIAVDNLNRTHPELMGALQHLSLNLRSAFVHSIAARKESCTNRSLAVVGTPTRKAAAPMAFNESPCKKGFAGFAKRRMDGGGYSDVSACKIDPAVSHLEQQQSELQATTSRIGEHERLELQRASNRASEHERLQLQRAAKEAQEAASEMALRMASMEAQASKDRDSMRDELAAVFEVLKEREHCLLRTEQAQADYEAQLSAERKRLELQRRSLSNLNIDLIKSAAGNLEVKLDDAEPEDTLVDPADTLLDSAECEVSNDVAVEDTSEAEDSLWDLDWNTLASRSPVTS